MRPDPGNLWCPEKTLSQRLAQAKRQWLNLGERQQGMMDNFILSAEWLEDRIKELEAAHVE